MRPTYRVTALADRHSFVKLSDRVAIITQALKRPGKNGRRARVVTAYFGFASQSDAQAFITGLRRYFPKAFCQVRSAERLTTAYEVKVRGFDGLEAFIWELNQRQAIVTPTVTPEQAKRDLFPTEVEPASNVVSFADRSTAPLAARSRARTVQVGNRAISIE